MTREEAIRWLKDMKDTIELYNSLSNSYTFDKFPQALDMAISALKGEKDGIIRYKLSKPIEYIELVYTDKEVTQLSYDSNITLVTPKAEKQTEPSDLISRAELLKPIEESYRNAGLHSEDYHKIKRWIKKAPSVSAERVGDKK